MILFPELQAANAFGVPVVPPVPCPAPNEPGTLEQQVATVRVSLYLGDRRGTSAEQQWTDARRLVIPHAGE